MIFKFKVIFPILIFMVGFFVTILQAAELAVPLPSDAMMTSERGPILGPLASAYKVYKTSLDKNRLAAFYKKEMLKAGWKEDKDLLFTKDNDRVTIVINSSKTKTKKTSFLISTSKIPKAGESLAMRKKNPDKLNFMPLYPGSEQAALWDLTNGVFASYETGNSIKDVVFFYKSGMLNYGWSLASETPVKTAIGDCPTCKKSALAEQTKSAEFIKPGSSSQTSLTFRRGKNETCVIKITGSVKQNDTLSDKTTILVSYREHKPIKF